MLTIPYLARLLKPEGWGPVVLAQAFAGWMALLLEYGFNLSATREVARCRDDAAQLAPVVSGVMGASVLLISVSAVAAVICALTVESFQKLPAYLWLAWLIALTQGLRPLWFFQGLEQMTGPAYLNVGGRLLSTFGIFLWVKSAQDGWKVLTLQALAGAAVSIATMVWMYRLVPFLRPRMSQSLASLKMGWSMFLFRSAVSLYTTANTFVLGLYVVPSLVAFYGGAERISKAALGTLSPISQALYPRISRMAADDKTRAAHMARIGLWGIGGMGAAAGAALFVLAPLGVRLLLGAAYGPAVPLLRIMALLLPLIAVSNVLGIQWMLPLGLDKSFNRVILTAGLVNLALAVIFAPRFGPQGMAWAVVISETYVTAGLAISLLRSGNTFWRTGKA